MDAQRALLDSLMGLNRDGDRPDDDATMDFRHPRVCKPYLCGLCPRELFQNTRLDLGTCKSLHLPTLRSAYEEQKSARDFGYERELSNELSRLLVDVEKKIARAQRRLAEDGEDNQTRTQILQLTQDMQDATVQAEKATKDGDPDRSLRMMEKMEILKRKRRELLTQSNAGVSNGVDNVNQKLRVCDVCGAFLSIFDIGVEVRVTSGSDAGTIGIGTSVDAAPDAMRHPVTRGMDVCAVAQTYISLIYVTLFSLRCSGHLPILL
ncbi:hypothetical protein PI125_g9847 [Phytophthora idaei]|nr:hypothetical protein PI125_g9847 [Phytophthora idaei]